MILITFSYAIAGFAVDLMYVVSGLFALLINVAGFSTDTVGQIFASISGTSAAYNLPIIGGLWILFEMLAYFVMFLIASIWTLISLFITGGLSIFGALLGVVFVLISVWILILAVWYTLKVPYVLIKTLVSLYLSIITAPLQILAGALVPSMGFGSWFKKLMADILVFPVVGLLFWFAWATLMSAFAQSGMDFARIGSPIQSVSWVPGIIGSGQGMSGVIFLAISFGLIVLIPKVPDMLKGLLLGEKFSFGMAMGEAVGPLRTGWGMTGGPILSGAQRNIGQTLSTNVYTVIADRVHRNQNSPQWLRNTFKQGGKVQEEKS
jgi:hypothetical protein